MSKGPPSASSKLSELLFGIAVTLLGKKALP